MSKLYKKDWDHIPKDFKEEAAGILAETKELRKSIDTLMIDVAKAAADNVISDMGIFVSVGYGKTDGLGSVMVQLEAWSKIVAETTLDAALQDIPPDMADENVMATFAAMLRKHADRLDPAKR